MCKDLEELFIKAVHAGGDQLDADVQIGLGVIFNLNGEYHKAVDCFKTALQIKPDVSSTKSWEK